MPLYEYECVDCGHLAEVLQRMSDPPLEKCPECGGTVRKLLSAPAFQFKGTGWYVTDYARKGQGDGDGKPDSKGGGEKSTASDSAKTAKTAKTAKSDKSDKKAKPAAGSSSD